MIARGDVFAVKLDRASYGLVHAVWTEPATKHTSLVFIDWFGDRPPTIADASKPIMVFTHPELAGEAGWLRHLDGATAPGAFTLLGKRAPTKPALALPLGDTWVDVDERHRSAVWPAVMDTLRREHAYRTDPEAALAARWSPGAVVAIETTHGFVVCLVVRAVGRVDADDHAVRYDLAVFAHRFARLPTLAEVTQTLAWPGLSSPHTLVRTEQSPPPEARRLGVAPLADPLPDGGAPGAWPTPGARPPGPGRSRG